MLNVLLNSLTWVSQRFWRMILCLSGRHFVYLKGEMWCLEVVINTGEIQREVLLKICLFLTVTQCYRVYLSQGWVHSNCPYFTRKSPVKCRKSIPECINVILWKGHTESHSWPTVLAPTHVQLIVS